MFALSLSNQFIILYLHDTNKQLRTVLFKWTENSENVNKTNEYSRMDGKGNSEEQVYAGKV